MKILDIISIFLHMTHLMLSLFGLWLTLGWKVRKTRKAFEKQLIRQGMAKMDAKRLSAQYLKIKNDMMNTLKRSFVRQFL